MVKPKSGSSKKQKRGVDFKKIKRKLGRKLPPPKNHTNTEIKSKAIILPEQSVASDRAGITVSKKGLTLRELLQQTSHHNAKIRKAALTGIKDLIQKHKSELKLHKIVIIEKLRERICDNDRNVRDTLYQLLESEIFPFLREDNIGPIVSIMMAYIFNAMTHMAVDIRLMAFKVFNLIVQNFPSSFILYAEKVLDSYIDILRNSQIYLQEKNKLKNVLDGLVRCMSAFESRNVNSSNETSTVELRRLHSYGTVIHKDDKGIISVLRKFDDLVPILVNCFQESTSLLRAAPVFDAQSYDCVLKIVQCIHLAVELSVNGSESPLFTVPNGRRTMLIHLSKLWEPFPIGKMHSSNGEEDGRYFTLNVRIIEIFLHLSDWLDDKSIPIEKFLEFIESLLSGKVGSHLPSSKAFREKHIGPLVIFIPRLMVSQITNDWKLRLLEAFTGAYKNSKVDSKLSLAYLSAIEEMLLPVKSASVLSDDMLGYQLDWIQRLPNMLLLLGDKYPSISKVVLKLILNIGQRSHPNSLFGMVYDNLQFSLKGFYSDTVFKDERMEEEEKEETEVNEQRIHFKDSRHGSKDQTGVIHHKCFLKLPKDCQELAVCSLYYMSSLSSDFLLSLTDCCLSHNMELDMLLRIIDVLHSAYKSSHLDISEHIGFLVTLVAQKTFSDSGGKFSNQGVFRSLNSAVCSCLSEMGDNRLVLRLLCRNIFNEMSRKLPINNMYGLLCMIVSLDSAPTKLPDEIICNLSNWLFAYLVEVALSYMPNQISTNSLSNQVCRFRYYVQPCIFLFIGSNKLLLHVLKLFDSSINDDKLSGSEHLLKLFERVSMICSTLIFMHDDVRLDGSLSLCKEAVECILQNVSSILVMGKYALTLEEEHDLKNLYDQLKSRAFK